MPELEVSSGSFLSQIVALDLTIRLPRKKPKRHRGEPQVELRPFGLVLHAVSPLDPLFYGGRQLGSSCGFPKGAGGVGIDVASPTAAAAWVAFPA